MQDDLISFLPKCLLTFWDDFGFGLHDFLQEKESEEYKACRFLLNGKSVFYRESKITPKKIGQFVTFWKRGEKEIEPFETIDDFDFLIVYVVANELEGLFVFPKNILFEKGIVSSSQKEGKRAFRVYTSLDKTVSKQAIASQKWQIKYFFDLNNQEPTSRNMFQSLLLTGSISTEK